MLSPFAHELHYTGTRCADDCAACQWDRDRHTPTIEWLEQHVTNAQNSTGEKQ